VTINGEVIAEADINFPLLPDQELATDPFLARSRRSPIDGRP
jgi:hypothetical protein